VTLPPKTRSKMARWSRRVAAEGCVGPANHAGFWSRRGDTFSITLVATTSSTRLEDLTPGARVSGLLVPGSPVTVVQVEWHGTSAMTLTYREDNGRVDHEIL